MKQCKTNKLKLHFNIDKIDQDFSIAKFTTSQKFIKYGASCLDQINTSLKARSIVFEGGRSFYALFDKAIFDSVNLSRKLEKIEGGETLSFNELRIDEVESLPKHILGQLLLNSISNPKNNRLSFSNLTGKLYLFSPFHFKISSLKNQEQIFKVIGLEIKISYHLTLHLKVKTFSSVLLSKKMDFSKKRLTEYPKYTFVHSTGTFRRVLQSEKISQTDLYIIKQTHRNGVLEKNNIPFMEFANLKEFNNSKIGLLNIALIEAKQKLSPYMKVEFEEVSIESTVRFKSSFQVQHFAEQITLIDMIDDEDSKTEIIKVQEELKKLIPKSTFKIRKRESINRYNLRLIHSKAFYEKYELKDPYKPSVFSQHLTREDFKVCSKASLRALISESVIKNDISNKKVSIVDWQKYNFRQSWIFGNKIEDQFYFIFIHPSGQMEFEAFQPDLFNQSEYDELCDIFYDDSGVEFIIKDDLGNVNKIKKTDSFTVPEFEVIYHALIGESKALTLTKPQACQYVLNTFTEAEKAKNYISEINSIENWNKASLLNCFKSRTDKKRFSEIVEANTGEVLKSYLRDKTRYEILDSQLDIHLYNENGRYFYFVGTKGEGIQQQVSRASIIREVEPHGKSQFILRDILPLMNVDFVKNGNLTVLPFPIKYLREWVKAFNNN